MAGVTAVNKFAHGRSAVPTPIAQGAGSTIGNMTAGGGLAAHYDGNTAQATAAAGYHPTGGADGTSGKNFTASYARVAYSATIYGVTDGQGFYDSAVSITIYFEGSHDGSAWTALGNTGAFTCAASQVKTIVSTDQATAWEYLRIRIGSPGANSVRAAEVQFVELL